MRLCASALKRMSCVHGMFGTQSVREQTPTEGVTRMTRKLFITLLCLLTAALATAQNDALNLPAPLFVLQNEGVVQRYGRGAEGISPVTSSDAFVVDFGVAPDGNWIAYRTLDALVIREIRTERTQILDPTPGFPPLRGSGSTIAWSPTGATIAYTTETGLRVTVRESGESSSFEVVNSISTGGFQSVAWSPDGAYLVAVDAPGVRQIFVLQDGGLALVTQTPPSFDMVWTSPREVAFAPLEGGILRMNLADSNNQSVIRPASGFYSNMTLRANGEIAAFVRRGAIEDNTGVYTRINPVEAREDVVGNATIDLDGVAWTPQNDLIMVFRGGVLTLVNPTDGSGFALPISNAVAYDWGNLPLPAVQGYAVPRNLFFIAPDEISVAQVWQLPTSGNPPLRLTQAEQNITGYAITLDGTFIAYSSASLLWLQPVAGAPFTVAELGGDVNAQPDFSPDGQQLAYVDGSIRVFSLAEGTTTVYLQNEPDREYTNPRFSPDGAALMVDVITDNISTGIIDMASGEVQLFPAGYGNGRWLDSTRVMTFGGLRPQSQGGVQINDQGHVYVLLPDENYDADADIVERRAAEDVRLILRETLSGEQLRVVDYRQPAGLIPLTEGGFVDAPQLSPEGSVVAGLADVGLTTGGDLQGQLTLVNVLTGEQFTLSAPTGVSQIKWQQ